MRLILASASPRRREILDQVGAAYEICPSGAEERTEETEPDRVVMDLAIKKARDVIGKADNQGEAVILAADTVVSLEGRILQKPKEEEEAFSMLSSLSGHTHEVYTGIAIFLLDPKGVVMKKENYAVMTKVSVRDISKQQIRDYIKTGEPMDKAGAYAIQGRFAPYIEGIQGDYYNVVGLPVSSVAKTLEKMGIGGILC